MWADLNLNSMYWVLFCYLSRLAHHYLLVISQVSEKQRILLVLCWEIKSCPDCYFSKEKSFRRLIKDFSLCADETFVNLKNIDCWHECGFACFSLFTVKNARPKGSGNEQSAAVSRGDYSGTWGRWDKPGLCAVWEVFWRWAFSFRFDLVEIDSCLEVAWKHRVVASTVSSWCCYDASGSKRTKRMFQVLEMLMLNH